MPIKQMLSSANAVWIVAMVFMFILLNYTSSALQHDIKTAADIGRAEIYLLQLRRNEKDFLSRKNEKYEKIFSENIDRLTSQLDLLEADFAEFNYELYQRKDINTVLSEYHQLFNQSVELQKKIGINERTGFYGELRQAVRNIERILDPNEHQLHKQVLQLRRNEKDFMLRFEDKYAGKLQVNITIFLTYLENSDLSVSQQKKIIDLMTIYQDAFFNFLNAQKKLGYDEESGIIGEMRNKAHQVEKVVLRSLLKSQKAVDDSIHYINTLAISLSIIGFIIALICNCLFTST
jgi:methyl-accepting chemotaxis protein